MSKEFKPELHASRLSELGLMTASLTHELRQPLFAIRSLAQLALADEGEGARQHLTRLLNQTQILERIVEAVGSYAREDTGVMVPIDPNLPPQTCLNLMSHRAKQKGVELVVEIDQTASFASGEPTAILQVLVNLVQNAVDASPAGARVWIRSRALEAGVVFEVQDEGPGIPEAMKEEVFRAFYTTKGPQEGTGLGLFLASEMASRTHGELQLVSSEVGACFQLRLGLWRGA